MNKNKDSRQNAADSIDANIQRIEIDLTPFNKEPDCDSLPLLPTRNLVLFPELTIGFGTPLL